MSIFTLDPGVFCTTFDQTDMPGMKYHTYDHLGNLRVTYRRVGASLPVDALYEYSPYGRVVQTYQEAGRDRYLSTGHEREEATNYDYRLARLYDAELGRFLGVDAHAERYPSWTPYNYVYNNPINGIDPNGKDGILLVFPDYKISVRGMKVPYLGHAGVLLIDNKTGYTKYYEYGRYDSDQGNVRSYSVPNVVMGEDGRPTTVSLDKVMARISKISGQSGRIEGACVQSDEFTAMKSYAENLMSQNNDSKREPYSIWGNNCGTFGVDVLNQDSEVANKAPSIFDPRPNSIIEEYRSKFDKLDYNIEDGSSITPTKSLIDRFTDFFKSDDR